MQVVCGAPNARAGMKGVFGPAGVRIPKTGAVLNESTIRGVASRGMLMSAYELALGDDHDGIIELPEDAPVGTPYASLLGLDDPVIDIKVTPNRADCLGVRGIARDLAAAGLGRLKPLDTTPVEGRFRSPIAIHIEDLTACPLFLGRHIRGLSNGPSPRWLQRPARGDRAAADLGAGRHHQFPDLRPEPAAARLRCRQAQRRSVVRFARPGETLLALNGREYELDPEVTAIADDTGVQSLGGVIGGEPTGCTEATTEVFVEAALFDPVRTAATGRRLDIVSDARYRFERGVDPAFVGPGLEIATRLILELCGGEPSEVVIAGAVPEWRRSYALRPERPAALGGLHVPPDESRAILEALGCTVADAAEHDGSLTVIAAVLARRHRRRGRSRRGGVADQGLRPNPGGAAAARDRGVPPGDRPAPPPRRAGPPHPGRARADRGGDLLVHRRREAASCSAAPSRNCASSTRSAPISTRCARRACRIWSRRRGATPIAAFPMSRCSSSGRSIATTRRRGR